MRGKLGGKEEHGERNEKRGEEGWSGNILGAMRANIVTGAARDERGQEEDGKTKKKKR